MVLITNKDGIIKPIEKKLAKSKSRLNNREQICQSETAPRLLLFPLQKISKIQKISTTSYCCCNKYQEENAISNEEMSCYPLQKKREEVDRQKSKTLALNGRFSACAKHEKKT